MKKVKFIVILLMICFSLVFLPETFAAQKTMADWEVSMSQAQFYFHKDDYPTSLKYYKKALSEINQVKITPENEAEIEGFKIVINSEIADITDAIKKHIFIDKD